MYTSRVDIIQDICNVLLNKESDSAQVDENKLHDNSSRYSPDVD